MEDSLRLNYILTFLKKNILVKDLLSMQHMERRRNTSQTTVKEVVPYFELVPPLLLMQAKTYTVSFVATNSIYTGCFSYIPTIIAHIFTHIDGVNKHHIEREINKEFDSCLKHQLRQRLVDRVKSQ